MHHADRPAGSPARRRRYPLICLALGLLLYLPSLGEPVVRRQQELRVVMTARDMFQTGRWLSPHFLNEPRLRKPPLMYWLVGLLYRAGAPVDSAGWSRLPSALAGVAFLGALYGLGRSLVGRRRAFVAALVAGASMITLRQARLAETDMTLTLLTSVSALCGFLALRGRGRFMWPAAWLAAGLGFLIKGPAAITLPPLAWLCFGIWQRRRVVRPWRTPTFWVGLLVCACLMAPWYIYIHVRQDTATNQQLEAEFNALLVESHHQGSILYYTYTLLQAMAPWGVLLPVSLFVLRRAARSHAGVSFAVAWLATSFLVLSVISSKQIHYALLLVPPAALLTGVGLYSRRPGPQRYNRFVAQACAVLMLLGALGGVGYVLAKVRPTPLLPLAGAGLAAGAAALAIAPRRTLEVRMTLATAALALLLPAGMAVRESIGAGGTAMRSVVRTAVRQAPPDAPILCVGSMHGASAFYAGRPAQFPATLAEAWHAATPGTLILASWKEDDRPAAAALPATPLAEGQDRSCYAAAFLKPGRP